MTEKQKEQMRMYNPAFVEAELIIQQLEKYQKKVTSSPEKAREALMRAGLIE